MDTTNTANATATEIEMSASRLINMYSKWGFAEPQELGKSFYALPSKQVAKKKVNQKER
jgi:hypothetical protein